MSATQQRVFDATANSQSQAAKLIRHFQAHPRQWISMPELALQMTPTGIGAAVHSRVALLRQRYRMVILHRGGRDASGRNVSFYAFCPEGATIES